MATHKKARQPDWEATALDRISNLPINILHLILERLPLLDAARTTTLSKTWRTLWASQAELVFDDVFFQHLVSKKDKQASEVSLTISHILLVHSGSIWKFHLYIPKTLPLLHTDLWIRNISNSGVKKLELFNKPPSAYKMPSYLFSCSELTDLTLDNCILSPPLGFGGFCNLINARLFDVKIAANMSFGAQLETLDMKFCTGFRYLRGQFGCGNNIRKLTISYCVDIDWQWFKYTRNVETLCLKSGNWFRRVINLDSLVCKMPKIQVLLLNGIPKSVKPGASVFKRLRIMDKLIFLQLSVGFYDLVQTQSVICLLRSSPNLQNLRIRLGTVGSRSELHFIKLLLASSPSLVWMKISKRNTIRDPREELRILGEVTQLPRASTIARIIWN
ncbi:F-box/FBD/LRR-repeat protein At1g13570-like isoform X1 [Daucus carota subsp. sativus]|uniref:F-box/FBD/LRR-repeat protein At1g13570-like isoform X1 n=2 Tax=Daucus carota subsp. sativus TaxID=79200 RepID=UPI0007EFCE6F|nr:PREDICTED: F-box/FBD/LRR-repeat protein At1g13570-like isoform X1 [Daucus carota subsp. sativus]XP_017238150.1 PREDICTED: F-box/FBD/LRR-repeat protein At1g13570-like isoform X1 [Daucus carota subsp. sativus]